MHGGENSERAFALAELTVNSEIGPIGRKGAPDEIAEKPLMSSRGPSGVNRFSGIGCENSGDDAVGCHAASHRTFADRAPGDDDLMLDPQRSHRKIQFLGLLRRTFCPKCHQPFSKSSCFGSRYGDAQRRLSEVKHQQN
jgi:hypothetical protein